MVRAMIDEDPDFYPLYSDFSYVEMTFKGYSISVNNLFIGATITSVEGNGAIKSKID